MLGLPKSTEFNRRIPKNKFYSNLKPNSNLKRIFIDKIKNIYWRNKIAPSTLNLREGSNIDELEVFEVVVTDKDLPEEFFREIDKAIPYHILFILTDGEDQQAIIGFKEKNKSGTGFRTDRYYKTEWRNKDEFSLDLNGISLDEIYEGFLRQIAGSRLRKSRSAETLKESIAKQEEREMLEKKILTLKSNIRREKQFNRQVEMNTELKKLKQRLEEL